MLHIAFLRSPFAHARITSVDVSAARSLPGVIAAFSGADFADEQGSLPCAWPVTPDIVIPAHPPMATDEVRYVGEAVACVVARDRYAAADARGRDRHRLRAAAAGAGHPDRAGRGLAQGARGGQQELRVGLRQRRPGRGLPRRPGGARAQLPPAAADPQRDGAARGGLLVRGRRVHAVVGDPDPARAPGHARPGDRHPGAEHPGHRARRRRRVRLQAAGHRRRGAGRC